MTEANLIILEGFLELFPGMLDGGIWVVGDDTDLGLNG